MCPLFRIKINKMSILLKTKYKLNLTPIKPMAFFSKNRKKQTYNL